MKKSSLIGSVTAILLAAFFALCYWTSDSHDEKSANVEEETVTLIQSDDWNEIMTTVYIEVNKRFPECAFYTASGQLKKIDDEMWGVDHNTFSAVFGNLINPGHAKAYVENDTLKFKFAEDPWVGCRHMTPFVLCDMTRAVECIQKEVDMCPEGDWMVLIFGIGDDNEPSWVIETDSARYSVKAYSLEVE